MKRTRNRRVKRFKVTREHKYVVTFWVDATSALNARQTPTPTAATWVHCGATVGTAIEDYSQPGSEQAIANSPSTNE